MTAPVDLYNFSYSNFTCQVYGDIRRDTYGDDYGQNGWVTAAELQEMPQLLQISAASRILELGCGSGGYAVRLVREVGCRVVGLDVNGEGIRHAVELACREKLTDRATFELCDISKTLPLEDAIFDAVYSNDVLCHVPGRAQVLSELRRVLRPAGRLLFSDALVITGLVSHQEIAARSSLAEHFFSPPGENERSIEQAGFHLVGIRDTTAGIAELSRRCRDAREIRKLDLLAIEGEETFAGMQQFLSVVHRLTAEGRVRRFLYVAEA